MASRTYAPPAAVDAGDRLADVPPNRGPDVIRFSCRRGLKRWFAGARRSDSSGRIHSRANSAARRTLEATPVGP
ncbi:hypothetical protein GCM10023088_17730 [Actinomadura verrucosospora]